MKQDKIQCLKCKRWLNRKGTAIFNHAINGRTSCQFSTNKGRRPKLNKKIVDRLEVAAKNGLSVEDMCTVVGISRETYNQWRKNFPDFNDKIRRAEIDLKTIALKSIKLGMITDWRAGAWYLERIDSRYKKRKEIEINNRPILVQDAIILEEHK